MSRRKSVTKRRRRVKGSMEARVKRGKRKPEAPPPPPDPSKTFATIGVRFIDGPNVYKVFTYQIKRGTSIHVGQELIADTPNGPKLCICVRLDDRYNPEEFPGELKTITRRVVPL